MHILLQVEITAVLGHTLCIWLRSRKWIQCLRILPGSGQLLAWMGKGRDGSTECCSSGKTCNKRQNPNEGQCCFPHLFVCPNPSRTAMAGCLWQVMGCILFRHLHTVHNRLINLWHHDLRVIFGRVEIREGGNVCVWEVRWPRQFPGNLIVFLKAGFQEDELSFHNTINPTPLFTVCKEK